MPINFTVVPVEDAEGGGGSAGAAGGAKPVPTVVVEEDGDPSLAQDSGTSLTGRTPAAALLLFRFTTEIVSLSHTYARAHRQTHRRQ